MKRFHPSWMLFEIGASLKSWWFALVFFFVLNAGVQSGWKLWGRYALIVGAIWTLIHIVLKWYRHTYELKDHSLVMKEGAFVKKERDIPYSRIQNTHRKTNAAHRLFRKTSLTLETGTNDDDASFVFPVITKEEAERIEHSLRGTAVMETVHESKVVLFRSTNKDDWKAAFISLRFFAIFPIALTIYSQADDLFNIENSSRTAIEYFKSHLWLLLPLFIIAMCLSVVIGYIQTKMKYGSFEIAADDDMIYLSKGTVSTTAFSIKKSRVQAIKIKQPFLKRLFGMAEITLISAGALGDIAQESSKLYPFMAKQKAYELTMQLLPDYRIEEKMKRLPKEALVLRLLRPYYITVLIGAIIIVFKGSLLFLACFFLLAVLARVLNYWLTSYHQEGDFVQIRKGGIFNETFITKREKIQRIEVSHSWLQRKFKRATIQFANRSKPLQINEMKDVSMEEGSGFYEWYKGESSK